MVCLMTTSVQDCYAQCKATKDAALAAAALLPWPGKILAIAQAVQEFNQCRKNCDTNKERNARGY